jgi:transcriptional regulator with XRE-family HTH domain
MSTQQLSDACTELGLPIARSVLANFESGRRPTVSVPEIMALAMALDVAPVLLVFPLGHQERVEMSRGREVPTWDALKWFTGRDAPQSAERPESDVPTQLWEAHDDAITSLRESLDFLLRSAERGTIPADDAQRLLRSARSMKEDTLRGIRSRMGTLGLTPPPLPKDLEELDQTSGGDTT